MTPKFSAQHTLRQFFAASIEDTFYARLGICAPDVVDYLSDLLVKFVHVNDIYSLKSASGDPLRHVVDMLAKAYLGPDVPERIRDRDIHRHVGDYTLYWTGMYPECLEQFQRSGIKDCVLDYRAQGKESYAIASELTQLEDVMAAETLMQLSEHFEDCAHGLFLARRSWEEPLMPE